MKREKTIRITCKGAAMLAIGRLRPLQGDLKTLSDEDYGKLKTAIARHGFSFPELVWKNRNIYWIVDGHQRVKTVLRMMEEGWRLPQGSLPIDFTEASNKKEAYEKILLGTSQYGHYNEESIAAFINLSKMNFDALKLKIDLPQINLGRLELALNPSNEKDDETPEVPKKAITKCNDVWILGEHRLLCGDSRKEKSYSTLMNDSVAALVITDPPYAIKTLAGFGSKGNRSYAKLETPPLFDDWMPSSVKYSRENGGFFVWEDWRNVVPLWQALEKNVGEVKDFVVWHVTNRRARQFRKGFYPEFDLCLFAAKNKNFEWHFPDTGSRSNVYTSAAVQDDSGVYGKKPVAIISNFIELTTSNGDFVLEPFSGSGTTMIAAEKLNRICYGIEIEPKYVDVAVERWENFTGKKAKRKRI